MKSINPSGGTLTPSSSLKKIKFIPTASYQPVFQTYLKEPERILNTQSLGKEMQIGTVVPSYSPNTETSKNQLNDTSNILSPMAKKIKIETEVSSNTQVSKNHCNTDDISTLLPLEIKIESIVSLNTGMSESPTGQNIIQKPACNMVSV